uniref:acylaminoacyl-peptidase n=1 Tax=Strigamia maritima TaxID=126957 RepID=T1J7M8_STRMM
METTSIQRIVDIYRKLSRIPTPVKGFLTPTSSTVLKVNVINSQRDLERSEKVKSLRNFVFTLDRFEILAANSPVEITSEQLRTDTKNGNKTVVLRMIKLNKTEEKQFLEIWEESEKIINLDLKALDIHGKVYEDSVFGGLRWSPDEKKIVYVAEKKKPSTESFFKTKSASSKETPDVTPGNEYVYTEDWGESLVGKSHPVPFILDVESGSVKAVENIPDDVSFGQPIWTPEHNILCVGHWQEPRRLGIIYCTNRRCGLFHLLLNENKYEIIGSSDKNVDSPRFSHDGSLLVYLERVAGGPHHQGAKLMMCKWATKEIQVLVDLINFPEGDGFPGIYTVHLPDRIWSSDNNFVVFSSVWRSSEELICINVTTRKLSKLISKRGNYSSTLLDFFDDVILATISTPQSPPVIGRFSNPQKEINWIPLWKENNIPNIAWKVLKLNPTVKTVHPKYPNLQYEAIYIHPIIQTGDFFPLIVWPHGGPHSAYLSSFNLFAAIFAELGFSTLLVNYRGSVGFGEDSIDSLLGNIGVNDVYDCQNAVQTLASEVSFKNIMLYGGSHGGFLSAQLIGQFPDFYKACVCRNPVIDITTKVGISDIPDWNWVECGLEFQFTSLPSIDQLKLMLEKSPITYIDQVKTPVLLAIGKADLRVPPSQGYLFHHALKARNKKVKMCTYDDNHALSKVDVEADSFVNAILWFLNHLNKYKEKK